MNKRPVLTKELKSSDFQQYYYLKEELISFCKEIGLQTTGSKADLIQRIVIFLDTGERIKKVAIRPQTSTCLITLETVIEKDFICSERHRQFYKEQIGPSFSFLVPFQNWLKTNAGKTYQESIEAYYQIREEKKIKKNSIDQQFEYNTYIRDFFLDNKEKSLQDAIKCWKYKKSLKGHHKYESTDLIALE